MTTKDTKIFDSLINKFTKNKNKIKEALLEIKNLLANESAETKEMLNIYQRYISGENIDKKTIDKANQQFSDVIKSIGLAGIFALPGGILAIAFLVKLGKVFNVDIHSHLSFVFLFRGIAMERER